MMMMMMHQSHVEIIKKGRDEICSSFKEQKAKAS
jgi:hypothetical protein